MKIELPFDPACVLLTVQRNEHPCDTCSTPPEFRKMCRECSDRKRPRKCPVAYKIEQHDDWWFEISGNAVTKEISISEPMEPDYDAPCPVHGADGTYHRTIKDAEEAIAALMKEGAQ